MASTASSHKGAMVVAMCVMLLHSSMGQQPAPAPAPAPPPLPFCSNCISGCVQSCQAKSLAERQMCSLKLEGYGVCMMGCTGNCNGGNSYPAHDCCKMNSCSLSTCGPPCVVDCCKFCSDRIGVEYGQCLFFAERIMSTCPSPCINSCFSNCINDTAPAPMA